MDELIDNEYFNWLCAKVLPFHNPPYVYIDLLRILYRTEFVWIVLGDRNRYEEGVELRTDFLREVRVSPNPQWLEMPCSVFEMLYALSKRANFQTDIPTQEWFWKFLENLGLDGYHHVSRQDERLIERILHTWIWRIYDPSGYGGLFPMREPKQDQTRVEIWFQFCAWIDEEGLV